MLQSLRNYVYDAAGDFLDFIDERSVVRRVMVLIVLWQLCDVYIFAKTLVLLPGKTGIEISAIIAALTVPVTMLQGFLFKQYSDTRSSS